MLDPTKIIRAAIITARRLPDPRFGQGFAKGGETKVAKVKAKKVKPKTLKGPIEKPAFGSHPAHKIPGIHIVTAETGEPVFTGEK